MKAATPTFGFYQLENLLRQQAKFMMVVLTAREDLIPKHDFIRVDLSADASSAPSKIQQKMTESRYPLWWPIVLLSEDGKEDAAVAATLEAEGYVNVFSFQDGWNSLIKESTRPS